VSETKNFRPSSHPTVQQDRRVASQSRNTRRHRLLVYASLPQTVFVGSPGIEVNRVVWWLILNLVILSVRPRRKGPDYDKIWNRERNESPLKTITRSQSDKLAATLASVSPCIIVDWGMRYGNPSIESRLNTLSSQGCDRILVVPMYPQYAAATTATVYDEASRALAKMRWQPTLRFAPPYYDKPGYIDALAKSLQSTLANLSFAPQVIIASFHGMPQKYLEKGDPYYCQCAKTARLLSEKLGLKEDQFLMTFQSRLLNGSNPILTLRSRA